MGIIPGQRGVGFIIKKDIKHMVLDLVGILERIAVLKLTTRNSTITVMQVHAPTGAYNKVKVEDFYMKQAASLDRFKFPMNLIIGDFNTKVGQRSHEDEDSVGPYGYGARNERGDRLVQFAQEHQLKIANTFFRKHPISKWTWISPDGRTTNEIDYILSDRQSSIRDTEVIRNLKFSRNHRMVRARVELKKENDAG